MMPPLTRLERGLDICFSQWRSADGKSVSDLLFTPIDEKQIEAWLNGADPPRPVSVPKGWVHIASHLERIFTNGNQEIGPNEYGDISGYGPDGEFAPEILKAVIQEPGDKPVVVLLASASITKDKDGKVSSKSPISAHTTDNAQTIPTYTITKDVATKVTEK